MACCKHNVHHCAAVAINVDLVMLMLAMLCK
jgi:hypothetical protein